MTKIKAHALLDKIKSDYKRPIVAKPVSQTVQQWYEKENF